MSPYIFIDVSLLTGESLPVARICEPVTADNIHSSEASNLVFADSTVASDRGVVVVCATGSHTEFGQVAHLTAHVKLEASTLEVQISRVVHIITIIALSMSVVIFLLTKLVVGMQLRKSFIFAIGIIVVFVPEGLLPTVSLALAIGVKPMANKNALVRPLSAVETLSATTVICTDKTGTLTKNEMTVRQLWIIPNTQINVTGVGYEPKGEVEITYGEYESQVWLMLAGAALCSNARLNHPPNSNQ
jgi:Ca2+-transporting ATPase